MILRPEGQVAITGTSAISNGIGKVVVGVGSLIASLTITFPSAPNDRDNLLMFFNGGVTVLTLVATVLGSLPTSAATGAVMCYEYESTTAKWYRLY